jgi:hypothetical protein
VKTILIATAAALLAGAGVSGAQTSHVFGDGGQTYAFDAQCHRLSFIPPGISTHEMVNVLGQQVRCLVRRPDPFARCVRKANLAVVETADHGRGRPGDEIGAKDALAAVQKCASARY